MSYFKRNPNALPILLGTLIFISILVWAGFNQGTFGGSDKAAAPAPAPATPAVVTIDSTGNRPSA